MNIRVEDLPRIQQNQITNNTLMYASNNGIPYSTTIIDVASQVSGVTGQYVIMSQLSGTSGVLNATIAVTGQQNYISTTNNSLNLSGNLQSTGINLLSIIQNTGQTNYNLIIGLSGNLNSTGSILNNKLNNYVNKSGDIITGVLTISGGNTISPTLTILQRWNNSEKQTGILVNITDSLSSGTSSFAEFKLNNTSKISFQKNGIINFGSTVVTIDPTASSDRLSFIKPDLGDGAGNGGYMGFQVMNNADVLSSGGQFFAIGSNYPNDYAGFNHYGVNNTNGLACQFNLFTYGLPDLDNLIDIVSAGITFQCNQSFTPYFDFKGDGTDGAILPYVRIQSAGTGNGRVGINTINPTYELDINGNIGNSNGLYTGSKISPGSSLLINNNGLILLDWQNRILSGDENNNGWTSYSPFTVRQELDVFGDIVVNAGNLWVDNDINAGRHIVGQHIGGNPTGSTGAALGLNSVGTVSGHDIAGQIKVSASGICSGNNVIYAVYFNQLYTDIYNPVAIFSPANRNAAQLTGNQNIWISGDKTALYFMAGSAPLPTNTVYIWNYHVIQ